MGPEKLASYIRGYRMFVSPPWASTVCSGWRYPPSWSRFSIFISCSRPGSATYAWSTTVLRRPTSLMMGHIWWER